MDGPASRKRAAHVPADRGRMKPSVCLFALCLLATACSKQDPLPVTVKVRVPSSDAGDPRAREEYQTRWLGSQTVTVAPGVHVLSRLFPSAAFAIETNKGVILVDSGMDESGQPATRKPLGGWAEGRSDSLHLVDPCALRSRVRRK